MTDRGYRSLRLISYASMLVLGTYLAGFQRLMDLLTKRFDGNLVLGGLIVSCHFAGAMSGPLLLGECSDRLGRRGVLSLCFVLLGAGLALISLSASLGLFIAGVVLTGAAFATLESTLSALLCDTAPGDSSRVIMIGQFCFCVGTVAGPLLVAAYLQAALPWQALYGVWVVCAAALAVYYVRTQYPARPPAEQKVGGIALALVRRPLFLLLCLVMLLYVGVEEGLAFWLTSYVGVSNMPALYATWMLPAFWLGMTVGKLAFMQVRRHAVGVNAGGALAAALCVGTLALWGQPLGGVLLVFGAGALLSGIFPLVMTLAEQAFPAVTGTAFGIIMVCCAAGGLSVPLLMGVVSEHTGGFTAALLLCMVLLVAMTALMLRVARLIRHQKT